MTTVDQGTMVRTAWVETLGAETRYYDAAGVRTRAIEAGQGEPLILLHGVGGHGEIWMRNVLPLAEHFHVYVLDMLGHGLTGKPDVEYNIQAYVDHLIDFMDARSIERAHFVGESLGGWVATWLAHKHPERAGKIVLACGAGLTDPREGADENEGRRLLQRLNSAVAEQTTRETVRKRLEFLVYRPERITDEMVEIRYKIYTRPEMQKALPSIFSMVGEKREPYLLTPDILKSVQSPLFFLWTRYDPTCAWEIAKANHELVPGSSFYLMEDAGHWPQFEYPEEFDEQTIDFLKNSQ